MTFEIDDWMNIPVIRSSSCPGKLPIRVKYSTFEPDYGYNKLLVDEPKPLNYFFLEIFSKASW